MSSLLYTAKTGAVTVIPNSERPAGLTGFISYGRLAEALRDAGCIASYEDLTHLSINDDGVTMHLKARQR